MSKKIKLFLGIVVLIIIASGLFLGSKQIWSKIAPNKDTYKIGVILPLSGDLASLGENSKNGALLAYQELTERQKEKIQLIFEDDHFDPKSTVSAFNKLINIDEASLIICATSGPCSAIAPLAEQSQVPLIAVASNPKIQENKNFVVRLEIAPSEEAKLLLAYLKEKDYKRIASIVATQDGILAGYTELKKDLIFREREVYSEKVDPSLKDFRTSLTKILAQNPDIIFVGLLPGIAGDFGRQVKEMGYTGAFVGLNFLEGDETLVSAKGSLNGIVYTNAQDAQSWFSQLYEKTYHKAKGPGSAHLYDAIKLIAKALETNNVASAKMATYLNSIKNYNGALGLFSSTDTHEFTLPVMLKTIVNNQFTIY